MEFKQLKEGVTYRPLSHKNLLVEMAPHTKVAIQGQCEILVLKGSVKVMGMDILSTYPALPLFSPKTHYSLLTIEAINPSPLRNEDNVKQFLEKEGQHLPSTPHPFTVQQLKEMEGAVIVLHAIDNRWCDGMREYFSRGEELVGPKVVGLSLTTIPPVNSLIFKMGVKLFPDRMAVENKVLDLPKGWDTILSNILSTSPRTRIATFGGKGVGKSTFNRWLVNQLLSKYYTGPVLFVDVDIGQPEFTPPGVISVHELTKPLLGPNYTHLQKPLKAFYIGSVSATDDRFIYVNAMRELAKFIKGNETLRTRRIVLNTMGYCTGLGIDFAVETIRMFEPSSVVQIRTNNKQLAFPSLLTSQYVTRYTTDFTPASNQFSGNNGPRPPSTSVPANHRMYEFPSVSSHEAPHPNTNAAQTQPGAAPKTLREIVMISYFATEIGTDLLGTRPKVLPMDKVALGCKDKNFSAAKTLEVLNGNLVALCALSVHTLTRVAMTTTECRVIQWDEGRATTPVEFFGYGIVRNIDTRDKKIFIITPLDDKTLVESVNCIIGGAETIGLPTSFHAAINSASTPAKFQSNGAGNLLNNTSNRHRVPYRTANPLKNALV